MARRSLAAVKTELSSSGGPKLRSAHRHILIVSLMPTFIDTALAGFDIIRTLSCTSLRLCVILGVLPR